MIESDLINNNNNNEGKQKQQRTNASKLMTLGDTYRTTD